MQMGKRERLSRKLDAWLGRRTWNAAKLNSLLNLTVSRIAVLRHQRRVRRDHARSDVAELLRQGHQERALLRAEYVIKEENMLDAFAMLESYCHVVADRSALLENQNQRECPEELREAIAGLIFAESRCGELPELREVRSILASRLGKEFVAAAVELRNNCGVNSRIIQKMSTKQASLESRTKVAMDIATELGIAVHVEEPSSELPTPPSSTPTQPDAGTAAGAVSGFDREKYLSESANVKDRYKNAASAAQAAFESAAYAAAAARAAVELSRSESQGKVGTGDQSNPRAPARATSGGRRYPAQSSSSETESKEEKEQSKKPAPFPGEGKRRMADDSSEEDEEESEEDGLGGGELTGNQPPPPMQSRAPDSRNRPEHGFRAQREVGVRLEEDTTSDEEEEEETKPQMAAFRRRSRPARRQDSRERSQRRDPNRAEDRYRQEEEEEEDTATHGSEKPTGRNVAGRTPVNRSGVGKGPVSMRTRRGGF